MSIVACTSDMRRSNEEKQTVADSVKAKVIFHTTGSAKHHITAITADNNSNINILPNSTDPRGSAHLRPQQVSIIIACSCTDYINYSSAPKTRQK